jgi:hypothetical protein
MDNAMSVWHTPDATIRTSTSFSVGSRIEARAIDQVGVLSLGGNVMMARVGVGYVVVAMFGGVVLLVVCVGFGSVYGKGATSKKMV